MKDKIAREDIEELNRRLNRINLFGIDSLAGYNTPAYNNVVYRVSEIEKQMDRLMEYLKIEEITHPEKTIIRKKGR